MPPEHLFLGFTIGEWVGLCTIISILIGAIVWLIRVAIMQPFNLQMKELNSSIQNLTASSKADHSNFDFRLDKHDRKITQHDTEIGFLYDANGLKRKRVNGDD